MVCIQTEKNIKFQLKFDQFAVTCCANIKKTRKFVSSTETINSKIKK